MTHHSSGPRAQAPTGSPWVLKTACALALATTLTLVGCGGGGVRVCVTELDEPLYVTVITADVEVVTCTVDTKKT